MSTKLVSTLKQYRHDGTRWHHVFSKTRKRKGQCLVRHCKRVARIQVLRTSSGLRTIHFKACLTCQCRLYRANNPAREAYRQIRDRAFRRNQIFKLTFAEFCAIPRFDEYIRQRGRGVDELHLDREKVELGYVPGNLRVMTAAENLRKQREVDYCAGPY